MCSSLHTHIAEHCVVFIFKHGEQEDKVIKADKKIFGYARELTLILLQRLG